MRKFMVVDDHPTNVFILKRLLKHCGVECEVATNGAEAVEKAMFAPCDVILMDISMPIMDGITAAREIAKRLGDEGPAIIAVTANASADQRQKCAEAGFVGFIPKPVNMDQLHSTLAEIGIGE